MTKSNETFAQYEARMEAHDLNDYQSGLFLMELEKIWDAQAEKIRRKEARKAAQQAEWKEWDEFVEQERKWIIDSRYGY